MGMGTSMGMVDKNGKEKWLVGGQLLLPEILGQPGPVGAKSPIFSRYSLVKVFCEIFVPPRRLQTPTL